VSCDGDIVSRQPLNTKSACIDGIDRGAGIIGVTEPCENLRAALRGATSAAHDLLDGSVRIASGWSTRDEYSRFLSLQFAARAPVEKWLASHAPKPVCPHAQCGLIACDLAELDIANPVPVSEFSLAPLPGSDGTGEALGVAWALAGSALGNAAILKQVRRASHGDPRGPWPHAFLGDEAMLSFWKSLRRQIERPATIAEIAASSHGASAVFEHFILHTREQAESGALMPGNASLVGSMA
jgi:heme oxygenase